MLHRRYLYTSVSKYENPLLPTLSSLPLGKWSWFNLCPTDKLLSLVFWLAVSAPVDQRTCLNSSQNPYRINKLSCYLQHNESYKHGHAYRVCRQTILHCSSYFGFIQNPLSRSCFHMEVSNNRGQTITTRGWTRCSWTGFDTWLIQVNSS